MVDAWGGGGGSGGGPPLRNDRRSTRAAVYRILPDGIWDVLWSSPDDLPYDVLPDEERSTKLPLLGNIAAGSPIEAVENREELDLEQMFRAKDGVYVLRVRGDSMIDDHLCDGDYVVIERRESARNGEQVVALLDSGEATLKRFYREGGGKIRLQPANASMQPRIVNADQCKIQGVVIGVLRSYMN